MVSGNSVEWYFRNEAHTNDTHCCRPFTRLLCKNWGSVAGGSFLNAFFNLFDLISDFFRVFICLCSVNLRELVESATVAIQRAASAITVLS